MDGDERKRRLATILAADVVGYSALMSDDEEATVRTLKAHREVIDKFIARHDGRIFNTAGDAVLAEFGSAVEGVRCAIAIQDELRVRNAELVPGRRMLFRMGINVGDVFVDEGGDMLGDGVNVAARLEQIAQPGGICISGSTFEHVKNKLSIGFQDLGPQKVKNIPEPVPAFGITSAAVSVDGAAGTRRGAARRAGARRWIVAAAAVVLVVAAGGIAYREFMTGGPEPLSDFPSGTTSDSLSADRIAALMAGVTIAGTRNVDGQKFSIHLNPDKTATYEFAKADAPNGTTVRIVGQWWTDERRFCMQIPNFGYGRRYCPQIVVDAGELRAKRRFDGGEIPWTLTK
jgi:class 3 adenylate cyclase